MKILIATNHLHGTDGWSRYTTNLIGALERRNHEMLTIAPDDPLSFLTRPYKAFFLAGKIRRMMKKEAVDVLHFTVEPYALSVLFLPKNIREKTVLTIHGNYGVRPLRFWMTRFLWSSVLKRISRFITVSNYTKDAVIKELTDGVTCHFKDRTTVIHNGIRIPDWNHKKSKNDAKQIIHVGGVKPAKGVGEAIEACAIYKEKYKTPFHLTVIGRKKNDHYMQKLKELIAKKSLSDIVTFRGIISDEELVEAYKNADLLLVPSYTTKTSFEGFGLVYIEANAYGVPAIGPNTSGAAEAIKDGMSGFTVEIFDPEEIADRMHWVLDEKKIDSEKCIEWAKQHDIKNVSEAIERIYSSLHQGIYNVSL